MNRVHKSRTVWASGVRALQLSAVLACLFCVAATGTQAQSCPAVNDYQLQDTRASSVGGAPVLTDIGSGSNTFATDTVNGVSRRVLQFPQGNGVQIQPTSNTINNGNYSAVVLFKFANVSSFRRLLDFKNGTSDNGLYINNGLLDVPNTAVGVTPITGNTYVQVAVTRSPDGTVSVYANGIPQFSFPDSGVSTVWKSKGSFCS